MPWQYDGLRPVDVHELEDGFWWRHRRYVEATAAAIGAALSEKSADALKQQFFLLDHEDESLADA
jgi:hypothetical protein